MSWRNGTPGRSKCAVSKPAADGKLSGGRLVERPLEGNVDSPSRAHTVQSYVNTNRSIVEVIINGHTYQAPSLGKPVPDSGEDGPGLRSRVYVRQGQGPPDHLLEATKYRANI